MYDFMFSDFKGSDAWLFDAEKEKAARKRGTVFDNDQLKAILGIWAEVATAQPIHSVDRLTIPVDGGAAIIQPHRISFQQTAPTDAQMRAAMTHIEDRWGGKAVIPLDAPREFRLKARAYAEVYGVRVDDKSESFLALSLTKDELAQLPKMRADIRKAHADAPPARPNEEKALAAMYKARYPHLVPEPA